MSINRTGRLNGTDQLRTRSAGTRPLGAPEPQAQASASAEIFTDRLASASAAAGPTRADRAGESVGLAQAGLAALTGSAAYMAIKHGLKIKSKVDRIKRLTEHFDFGALRQGGAVRGHLVDGVRNYWQATMNKPLDPLKKIGKLERVGESMRVISAVDSALKLPGAVSKLADGATVPELADVGGKALNIVRGADSAVKVVRGVKGGLLPLKLAPGVSAVAGAMDAVGRGSNLVKNWGDMPTNERIANMAYLAGDVADMIGVIPLAYPITKVISAGFALVGMAAENWGTIKKVGGAIASGAASAVSSVAHAAADTAKDVVHAVEDVGKKALEGAKNILSHL